MSSDEPAETQGQRLVRLISCVERSTDRVEHVLPSVDHLALRRAAPSLASVLSSLRASGLDELAGPFERWQQLLRDFDRAVAGLTKLRDGAGVGETDHQRRLGVSIAEARRCREAVEEASEELRRLVASRIDAALAVTRDRRI